MRTIYSSCGIILLIIFSMIMPLLSQQEQSRRGRHAPGRNIVPTLLDGSISRSSSVKLEQRRQFKQVQNKIPPQTQFRQFLFTVNGVQDFLLNLPVRQQVAIHLFTYVMVDNAYIRIQNIQNEVPIKVYVYQNNNKIIHQSDFYYQNAIVFEGVELSTYTIRFMNSGSQKLITMNLKKLTESSHVQQMVNKDMVDQFSVTSYLLNQQLKYLFNNFQRYSMINFQSVKALLSNIRIYYYWQTGQTVVAVFVCFCQLSLIKRICRTQSIV